jgi:3-hydroxy-9,10-secoandrosta-1,3,5(10)-triene-9,17-dione monooxygenase reductase component
MGVEIIDPQRFREVLGHWPSGVVVITGTVSGVPSGMAMNSFTAVSLDPPLVGIFPAKSSTTWPGIRDSGKFCVNVLASHHEEISRLFSRKGVDRFSEIAWHERASGPGLDEAVAWIDCELFSELETGDHWLTLGRVVEIDLRAEVDPLVFHRGQYTALSPRKN